MNTDTIEISECPKCGDKHRYNILVQRSYLTSMINSGRTEIKRKVRVTRLFTCPVKNKDFQATLTFTDTPSTQIKDVSVQGIADE